MPRNNGIYSPPSGTTAVSQTPISSAAYNNFVTDITADQNNPRPIIAGGTGAATAGGARTNLGLGDAATRNVGTTAGTVAAGDDSRITGALPLDGSAAMTGPLVLPASTIAATSLHIEPGIDPTAPANGDVWIDSAGDGVLRLRRNGASVSLWDSSALELISKADAEAGTSTTNHLWSAERVAQAIAALTPPGLGVGQTLQRFAIPSQRTYDTAYQNTTGKTIMVFLNVKRLSSGTAYVELSDDGSTWGKLFAFTSYEHNQITFPVQNEQYYRINGAIVTNDAVYDCWAELR